MKVALTFLLWLLSSGAFAQGLGGPTIGGGVPCYQGGDCTSNSVNGTGQFTPTGVIANTSLGTLQAKAYILQAFFRETAGHVVSVAIGTTSGASDVLAAQTVPPSGTLTASITAFSKGWFSATQPQALFLTFSNGTGFAINAELDWKVGP